MKRGKKSGRRGWLDPKRGVDACYHIDVILSIAARRGSILCTMVCVRCWFREAVAGEAHTARHRPVACSCAWTYLFLFKLQLFQQRLSLVHYHQWQLAAIMSHFSHNTEWGGLLATTMTSLRYQPYSIHSFWWYHLPSWIFSFITLFHSRHFR